MLSPIKRYESDNYNYIAIHEHYEGYYEGIVFNIRQAIIADKEGNTQTINGILHVLSVCSSTPENIFGTNIELKAGCSYSFDRVYSLNNNINRNSEIYNIVTWLLTKGIPNTEVGKVLYGS